MKVTKTEDNKPLDKLNSNQKITILDYDKELDNKEMESLRIRK